LKTRPKQILGSLLLAFALSGTALTTMPTPPILIKFKKI
jgi:hypothetical protein